MYCRFCGKMIKDDSIFCPYCGQNLVSRSSSHHNLNYKLILSKYCSKFIHSRFFRLYITWFLIQCVLLYKAKSSFSNYFNNENLDPDKYNYGSIDKGIFPSDWLYPFRNLLNGIMGQDPLYVYDGSEFVIYTILLPILFGIFVINRETWFRMSTPNKSKISYWCVWYVAIWMIIVFPMGLFGLDILSWVFILGGIIIGLYGYNKIKETV